MSWVEGAKSKAVLKALAPIKSGWVIGVGSGSTMAYAVVELGRANKARKLQLSVVPTSHQIENLAISHGLNVRSLNEAVVIDFAIDGADQVQLPSLNLIKGGGAALLREKIVDSAARRLAIVVDETKLSKHLGGRQAVPLEILPMAQRSVQIRVTKMGGRAKLREGSGKVGPVITDNGNFILDADFGRIENAARLERRLKAVPGLIETGLFLNMVDVVYVGRQNGRVDLLE
ncbi:MAG: ribose 5-phosphate isomerase A [Candidatus Bathyarchaeia archaeon]